MFEVTTNKSEQLEEQQGCVYVCRVRMQAGRISRKELYTKGLEMKCKLWGVTEEPYGLDDLIILLQCLCPYVGGYGRLEEVYWFSILSLSSPVLSVNIYHRSIQPSSI